MTLFEWSRDMVLCQTLFEWSHDMVLWSGESVVTLHVLLSHDSHMTWLKRSHDIAEVVT